MSGLLFCLALAANVRATASDSLCTQARHYLLNRHLNGSYLDSGEAVLAAVARTGAADGLRLELRARFEIVRGERATAREEKLRHYRSAFAAAETLRTRYPRNPLGHAWWAAAQGRSLQLQGGAAMALGAGAVKRANERALALDPDCALASYALGRTCEELPGILGGGAKRAEAHYRRGIQSDPDYTIIRLALARLLIDQRRCDEARAELERLLSTANPTNPAEFFLDDRPAAQALLVKTSNNQ